jgi:hypothetical protein
VPKKCFGTLRSIVEGEKTFLPPRVPYICSYFIYGKIFFAAPSVRGVVRRRAVEASLSLPIKPIT